jgi:ribulose-bisphosphate carboxylase small chain
MRTVREYKSSLADPASRKLETFSYLPVMDENRIKKQVSYIVNNGWDAAIEHTEPEQALSHYWYMWKLPLFGERTVDRVLEEAAACRDAYPRHHIRLVGYDRQKQSQGTAMVIFRASVATPESG